MEETSLSTIPLNHKSNHPCGTTATTDNELMGGTRVIPEITLPSAMKDDSGGTCGVFGSDYWTTRDRVEQLAREPETDEDLPEYPTDEAVGWAIGLLSTAGQILGENFPRGSAAVGEDGGVRITWSRGDKEVRLVCGGTRENRSYIYFEDGPVYGVDDVVTGMRLAEFLMWLICDS